MSKKEKEVNRGLTRERAREIFAEFGIGEAPPDDPIYREPPSIVFVNRPPGPGKPVEEDA